MSSDFSDLTEWIGEQRDAIVADLVDLVSLETPSEDKELLAGGLAWIERWIEARIGLPDDRRFVDGGAYGDIVVLEYRAATPSDRLVTALCHYDTVWAAGTLEGWPAVIDGDRVTGPGVFDMKAGLVQLVWAIRANAELGLPLPNIRLLLNGDEEIGSTASRPVIEREVTDSDEVLVFEASANGAVKTARKGAGIFQLEVTGEEAHAGLDPEHGISAIDELSRIVVNLHDATDLDRGTTLNVGIMQGGTRTNVKAGKANANVDVRVSSDEEAARVDALFAGLVPVNAKANIRVSGGWNRPVMRRSAAIAKLFELAADVASDLGFTLSEKSVGGYSDGNLAAALGLPVLDGLGAIGDGAHSRGEWVSISGALRQTALTSGILSRLASTSRRDDSLTTS
ncbi:M20 family metallopeptidase [Pseudarthrobacter sulfonivorans]|uniref:M20 family metallopeptidase n=1 Tax=Pseudarthrobacter sulfonivorans TaxID=121292 RepID=UPI00168AC5F1|nr:M20 family metallopeptidase [Pseudarthrobacter sulfonivorans]